ncbi:hypothetical protein [Rhodoligotrophos ferricapiens]|uniref:hypothetical protein n=1 Tax=Rhodoligotrophos ferricapiens TaxID=3069264 RepID=UPI00315DAC6F
MSSVDAKDEARGQEEDEILQIGTSRLEWLFAAIGGLIVLGMAGYLAYFGLTAPETPPKLILEPVSVQQTADGYLLQGKVRNEGEMPATQVKVTGELMDGENPIERSSIEIDSVPQHSERRFGLQFSTDPSQHSPRLRIEGYVEP